MAEPTMTKSKQSAYDKHCDDLQKLSVAEDCVRRSTALLIETCMGHEDPSIAGLAALLEHNLKAEANARQAAANSVKIFFDEV